MKRTITTPDALEKLLSDRMLASGQDAGEIIRTALYEYLTPKPIKLEFPQLEQAIPLERPICYNKSCNDVSIVEYLKEGHYH